MWLRVRFLQEVRMTSICNVKFSEVDCMPFFEVLLIFYRNQLKFVCTYVYGKLAVTRNFFIVKYTFVQVFCSYIKYYNFYCCFQVDAQKLFEHLIKYLSDNFTKALDMYYLSSKANIFLLV